MVSGLIKKGADIPTVLALHFAWNVGRSWALPGLHNVIFGSGGAALAQTHLFSPCKQWIALTGSLHPNWGVGPLRSEHTRCPFWRSAHPSLCDQLLSWRLYLCGNQHEIKPQCRKGDASSNGALERRLLTLSTFSPATHVQQSAVASNGAVPPPRLVRTAPFDSNGTSPGPVLMP